MLEINQILNETCPAASQSLREVCFPSSFSIEKKPKSLEKISLNGGKRRSRIFRFCYLLWALFTLQIMLL